MLIVIVSPLKVLSYWNLNEINHEDREEGKSLKYYHIGI